MNQPDQKPSPKSSEVPASKDAQYRKDKIKAYYDANTEQLLQIGVTGPEMIHKVDTLTDIVFVTVNEQFGCFSRDDAKQPYQKFHYDKQHSAII